MYKFNILDKISLLLVLIGGLNWGIIGLTSFKCDLVRLIFRTDMATRIVYILVGVAALNLFFMILRIKSLGLKWNQK